MATEKFARTLNVDADADRSWAVLTDVDLLAGWVGIVHDVEELSRLEKYSAVLQDKVGPFKLRADLAIEAEVLEDRRRIRLRASGRDRAVDSRISVDAELALTPGNGTGTSVQVDGIYQVTGRVAGMGAGVIRKKADRILAEFFDHAGSELGARDAAVS